MADIDHEDGDITANSGGLIASPAFPALVALWFAALFGGGFLFLPPVLFDMIFGGATPLGEHTRIIVALGAAGVGLVLGLLIARQVRGGAEVPRAPAQPIASRKSVSRPPLDVRSALGLKRDDEDDDHLPLPGDDLELADEVAPPIDDPYFASAWSDSDAYEAEFAAEAPDSRSAAHEVAFDIEAPMPVPDSQPQVAPDDDPWDRPPEREPMAPSRYNPFADFARDGKPQRRGPAFDPAPAFEPEPEPEPAFAAPPRYNAAPPPPIWPAPRAEEPALKELGVAELVERLARALQRQSDAPQGHHVPPRAGAHRNESALSRSWPANGASPAPDLDHAMRSAIERLARLDDVA